jgi:hypothetical protein
MITAKQILQNRSIDDQTTATITLEVPWDETAFAHTLRILADHLTPEAFEGVDPIDYEPVSYDGEKKTFQIKYTLDVHGLLELEEEE